MSKAIYIFSRNKLNKNLIHKKLKNICNNLTPDNINISTQDHDIYISDNTAYAIYMDNSIFKKDHLNLLMGVLYENDECDWSKPEHKYPDGNYALFRGDHNKLEIVSDYVGTRTIWYYFDKDLLIASTSQLSIIMYLNSFDFNESVIPWMLSSGSLGPFLSWDKRIKCIPPDSSIVLDKKSWRIELKSNKVTFRNSNDSFKQHKSNLIKAIVKTFETLKGINLRQWMLQLSGGYDSRGIALFIKNIFRTPKSIKAVTWGHKESINEKRSDANVAMELSKTLGFNHHFFNLNKSTLSVEAIIDKFLLCSEGRIDHISGYMDGMEMWKELHNKNIIGLIRGDEGFGWLPVSDERSTRISIGCPLCSDFKNIENIIYDFELPSQTLPKNLNRKEKESIETWRDRLYHSYRLPIILASLSDIKFSFVEQINPLLSRSILNEVRNLPDKLRTNKYIFKSIVNSMGSKIPYATKDSTESLEAILKNESMISLIKKEINSDYSKNIFGKRFISFISTCIEKNNIEKSKRTKNIKKIISYYLPNFLINKLGGLKTKSSIDYIRIAFRILIIVKSHQMYTKHSLNGIEQTTIIKTS